MVVLGEVEDVGVEDEGEEEEEGEDVGEGDEGHTGLEGEQPEAVVLHTFLGGAAGDDGRWGFHY